MTRHDSPHFAIGILSFNHPEITEKCISSVLTIFPYPKNVFLIHNGSLKKHESRLKELFPNIKHVILENNIGFTGGANAVLTSLFAEFELGLFLTNDTELLSINPRFFNTNEILKINKSAFFSSVQILKRKTKKVDSLMGALDTRNGQLLHIKTEKDLELTQKQQHFKCYIPGAAFWINKKSFIITRGFDEDLFTYWEDVDLSLRASKAQISLDLDLLTVLEHKIGKTCHKNRFYTFEKYQTNRFIIMYKHKLLSLRFFYHSILDLIKFSHYNIFQISKVLKNIYIYIESSKKIKSLTHKPQRTH